MLTWLRPANDDSSCSALDTGLSRLHEAVLSMALMGSKLAIHARLFNNAHPLPPLFMHDRAQFWFSHDALSSNVGSALQYFSVHLHAPNASVVAPIGPPRFQKSIKQEPPVSGLPGHCQDFCSPFCFQFANQSFILPILLSLSVS